MNFTAVKHEVKTLAVYIVILLAFLEVLNSKVDTLRNEINTVVRVQCQSGNQQAVIGKYNDFVQTMRAQQLEAQQLNTKDKKFAKAEADAKYAERLRGDLIKVPKQDCSQPLLR